MKLTPWFRAVTQTPVRVGWYQVDWNGRLRTRHNDYWLWDGHQWWMPVGDEMLQSMDHAAPGDRWRGVLREGE